jgi:hypothetical protein
MARIVRFGAFVALVAVAIACDEGSSEAPATARDSGSESEEDAERDATTPPPESGTGGKGGSGGSATHIEGGKGGGPSMPRTINHAELLQVSPPSAALDDELVLRGKSFTRESYVRLNASEDQIAASFVSDTEMKIRVPRDYPLSKCEEVVKLFVEDSRGASSPHEVTFIQPSPSVEIAEPTIPAGSGVELKGRWLQSAAVMIVDQSLKVTASFDQLVFTIPRTTPVGPAQLLVQTRCGSATLDVEIAPKPPQILGIDPPGGAAPGGVLYVTADFTNRNAIAAVQLGKRTISATDRTQFAWPTYDYMEASSTFAVLMPADVPVSDVELTVMGHDGSSAPVMVHGIDPSPRMGPSANGIMYAPPGTGLAGAFPLGSGGAHHARVFNRETEVDSRWRYSLFIMRNDGDSGPACDSFGTIIANERLCPSPCVPSEGQLTCPCEGYSAATTCPEGTLICHPITGTYDLSQAKNEVVVTIDRSSSGGLIEKYRGGWARVDEEPLTRGGDVLILLRSDVTGLPLAIDHSLNPSCVH